MSHSRRRGALAAGLGCALLASACEQAAPLEHPTSAPAFSAPPVPLLAVAPQPSAVAWPSEAPPPWVPEPQGKPVAMAAGARCKTFRRLPALRYASNTLVEDACLEIPSDTTIEVREGATLAIVARNGLRVGKNVRFDAKGLAGQRGARAAFSSVILSPDSDSEIRALCVDRGNQCGCPSGERSLASIRGQTGGAGFPGGTVRVLAAELVSPSDFAGLALDVSGGVGGPPGDSGTQACTRGELRCVSPECSAGVAFGARGQNGSVSIALEGALPLAALERMKAATIPADAERAVTTQLGTAFADQTNELNVQALRRSWQRRAGEDVF